MPITLNYVTLDELDAVMLPNEQAATTDDFAGGGEEPIKNKNLIRQHLKFAESRVESYLNGYDLPLSPPPYSIKYCILTIAKYFLLIRDTQVSEAMEAQYDSAIDWLKEVQRGDASLPTVDEEPDSFVGFADRGDMIFEEIPFSHYAFGMSQTEL